MTIAELELQDLFAIRGDLSFASMLVALAAGFVLSLLLRWHYQRYGSPFSNREQFGLIFPFLVLTVTLVIAIVKSSLALSLGLVGALSIVRFRTPIKEPEELAYIFMAIAMGLGLGADQVGLTIVSSIVILAMMAALKRNPGAAAQNLYLSFHEPQNDSPTAIEELSALIVEHVRTCELRRVDLEGSTLQAVFFIDSRESSKVFGLLETLRERHPSASITLIDQNRVPGV